MKYWLGADLFKIGSDLLFLLSDDVMTDSGTDDVIRDESKLNLTLWVVSFRSCSSFSDSDDDVMIIFEFHSDMRDGSGTVNSGFE